MNISGVTRIRVLVLAGCMVLIFLYLRFFMQTEELDLTQLSYASPDSPVVVSVYYETLCPDSKHFVNRQLEPTFAKAGAYMNVRLVPYGKADTTVDKNGEITFDCQHGPIECDGNRIHSCVIDVIPEQHLQVALVSCMIKNNIIPRDAFHNCFDQNKVNPEYLPRIQECYETRKSAELLKANGELTKALRPKLAFVPTITLDGAQLNQADILKDLFAEVCKVLAGRGPRPEICQ